MNARHSSTNPTLSCEEIYALTGKAARTTRENCEDGRYISAYKDTAGAWRIP
jgi:hypothetical protein